MTPVDRLSSRTTRHGFTLVEILVVLGVMGVLMTIVGGALIRQTNSQRLQSAATDFAASLNQARNSVFQYNRNATITIAADGNSYTINMNNVTSNYTLPAGTIIAPAGTIIRYAAPYSVLTSTPTTLTVTQRGLNRVLAVRTVGILGNVVINAQ